MSKEVPTHEESNQAGDCTDDGSYPGTLYALETTPDLKPLYVEVSLNSAPLSMQVDTGASATIISSSTYSTLWEVPPPLSETKATLKTYIGEVIPVLGTLKTHVSCKQQAHDLNLFVVKGDGPSILGRDWLRFLRLDWREICSIDVTKPSKISQILGKFENVFRPGLGTFKGITVDIDVSS